MAETVRCVLFITLTIAFFGSADGATDSVPAAITVYRNPAFFRNLSERKENLGNEGEEEEEDKGDAYSNNSEEFYDFDDEYRYPGEPKKPNPPSSPDFITYFDESPEFQPEPREISPPRGGIQEEEHSDETEGENELNEGTRYGGLRSTTPSYHRYGNRESPDGERESSDEENGEGESREMRDYGYSGNQEDDRSEESDDEKEANEEDDSESAEHSSENAEEEPKKRSRYHVPMEKDLRMRVPEKVYEESKEYFNPVLNGGITAFHYPSTYEDLDYYSHEEDDKGQPYVDSKKGTREYLKDHSIEEVEDPRNPGNVRAGSKHIFRTVSKIGIKAFKPVLYVPHVHRIKKKYKILHKPKKFYKWLHYRELPDDSAYQLSSDYDSEFEFF